MSRKRRNKKQDIRMSESAEKSMHKYGDDVYNAVHNNLRNPDNPHDVTLPHLSSYYAKEGFKKGYDVGRREERAKVFNIQERIQAFRDEMQPICKKYGIGFLNSYVDMEISAGTIKFKEQFAGSFHDMMEAYVKEMVAEF
jgi:hypothetical protein